MVIKVAGLFGMMVLTAALLFKMAPDNAKDGPRLVFPNLKEQLSGLTSIKVTNSDGNSVSILKEDGLSLIHI